MRIIVTTKEYEYMGLLSAMYFTADEIGDNKVFFKHQGKNWILNPSEYEAAYIQPSDTETNKPIKSDGGSSAYYDFKVPQHYLDLIAETGIIKTEYLIHIIFGNSFDFGCTFKALVRAKGITDGAGKEGNTLDYELNKMNYYESKIKEKYGWKND